MSDLFRAPTLTIAARKIQAGKINGHKPSDLRKAKRRYALEQVLIAVIEAQNEHINDRWNWVGHNSYMHSQKLTLYDLRPLARELFEALCVRPLTVEQFVKTAKDSDDAVGDMIRDMRQDMHERKLRGESMPFFTTERSIKEYLESKPRVSAGALRTVKPFFARYRQHCDLLEMFG